jgi:NTE family protein
VNSWGLALCGGGVKCGAHLGALQVLLRSGWEFDAVAGSSSGAIAGALYAMGLTPEQMERELTRSRRRVFGLWPGLRGVGNSRRFRRWLADLSGGARLEELPRRLIITASDIAAGKPYYFTGGDLADALYASSALPGLFEPLELEGRVLADGCLLSPLPVEPLRQQGVSRVMGILFPDSPSKIRHVVDVVTRSFHVMMGHLAEKATRELDVVIQPEVGRYPIHDIRNLSRCVTAGEEAARKALAAMGYSPAPGWPAPEPTVPDRTGRQYGEETIACASTPSPSAS